MLARLPEPWSAASMQTALGERGILIRSCAMYPGLGERHVRFAVKDADANGRLLSAMQSVIAQTNPQHISQSHSQDTPHVKEGGSNDDLTVS
ncbi:Threonine-phosphate decarboxylase [compost metagenome]